VGMSAVVAAEEHGGRARRGWPRGAGVSKTIRALSPKVVSGG
jgi:hypothetical protein